MSIELITICLFATLLAFLALGLPIAFCLGCTGAVFGFALWGWKGLYMVATNTFGQMTSFILLAIPLFIFMANMLEYSGIADALYEMMYRWMGGLKGGLAMGTVAICALFAAMAGISGAAVITMGLIALPSMLKRNYDKNMAVGCIAAGGGLGILIPPSVLMIIYANYAQESVGRLFAGGILPGIMTAAIFMVYIGVRCFLQPKMGPTLPPEERASWSEKLISLRAVIAPIFLVVAVLGTILTGMATPTEAAGIGAAGAIACAAISRRLTWQNFKESSYRTLRLTAMILWICIGASIFSGVYTGLGAVELIREIVTALPVDRWVVLAAIQVSFLLLGMVLDPVGIVMICTPVYVPVIKALGFDPVWFGILFVMNMEIGYITPPFGYNLFYMKSIVPKEISMGDVIRSIVPFVALFMIALVIVIVVPQIALYLPTVMFQTSR